MTAPTITVSITGKTFTTGELQGFTAAGRAAIAAALAKIRNRRTRGATA